MNFGIRRDYQEEDFADKTVLESKRVKSIMWYLGYIIATGIVGVVVIVALLKIISV